MGSIKEAHLAEPELLVIDVSGAGDTTVMAFQDAVARAWEPATAERTTRDPKHLRRRSGCMWRWRHRGMIRLGAHRLLQAGFMRPLRAGLRERRAALADIRHYYNHERPHAALGGRPPISRTAGRDYRVAFDQPSEPFDMLPQQLAFEDLVEPTS